MLPDDDARRRMSVAAEVRLELNVADITQCRCIESVTESHDKGHEIIRLQTGDGTTVTKAGSEEVRRARLAEVQADMILSQSIAVVLFHLDAQPQVSAAAEYKECLSRAPWRFHHVAELTSKPSAHRRANARQEFHELSKELPLFAAGAVHCGGGVLRFTVFTRRRDEMVRFYSELLSAEPETVRGDFFLFRLQRSGGSGDVEVQLALKASERIVPYPSDRARLVFTVQEIPERLRTVDLDLVHLTDPDSNPITVHVGASRDNPPTQRDRTKTTVYDKDNDRSKGNWDKLETEKTVITDLSLECDPIKLKLIGDDFSPAEQQRPDVIPKQDPLISTPPRTTGPTLVRLGHRTRAKSPCPLNRKLNLTAMTIGDVPDSDRKCREQPAINQSETVDIIASF